MDTDNEWDELAEEWDANRKTPSATLAFFTAYANGDVLDAGCGNGRNSRLLAKTADHVTAMDASSAMLEKARRNCEGAANIRLLQGRIQKIPLPDASFDAVFCLAAFHHLKPEEHARGANELFRVLKSGGRLCMTVWNRRQDRFKAKPKQIDVPWRGKSRYYYFFDEDELTSLLQSAGFLVENTVYEKDGKATSATEAQNLCIVAKKP